jgi:hypothetical protein
MVGAAQAAAAKLLKPGFGRVIRLNDLAICGSAQIVFSRLSSVLVRQDRADQQADSLAR